MFPIIKRLDLLSGHMLNGAAVCAERPLTSYILYVV
jgi:hypothetical protein